MKAKTRANGGALRTSGASERRKLTAEEAAEIQAIEAKLRVRREQLGELQMEILVRKEKQIAIARALSSDVERRDARIKEIAAAHGIDISGASSAQWSFEPSARELAFQRIG